MLQSAALQQQLMVAALSCHMSDDYNRFVTAYRGRLIQSDNAVKAFFSARPHSEGYNTYKTRLANSASLRSLHDPRFCENARQVFDIALRRVPLGSAEQPQLIATGYEGCRSAEDKLLSAKAETKTKTAEPLMASAQVPTPAVRPAPRVKLALADRSVRISSPRLKPDTAAKPLGKLSPLPSIDVPEHKVVPPIIEAVRTPAPRDSATRDEPATIDQAQRAPSEFLDWEDDPPEDANDQVYEPQEPRREAGRGSNWGHYAFNDPHDATESDEQAADDRVPNAYRPGAVWMGDSGPAWRSDDEAPPPEWYPPPRRHFVLGPDGQWYMIIHGRWARP